MALPSITVPSTFGPSVVGANFLVPNATFLVELVAFLAVLFILRRKILPKLTGVLDERQKTIRQGVEDAEKAKQRAQEAEADYRKAIEEARQEARGLIDEANKVGEQLKAELRQRGEQEYERIVSRAQADIDASARRASEDLRQNLSETVILVVRKVVGEGLDADAHRELIDRTISEVEQEATAADGVKS
ncbi:MAG: F0F1 ATP synthase subunit B [Actinomycetota bacterium]|nr:F0F1 ATP synthase subunit B [Actinomycetota bacterium]